MTEIDRCQTPEQLRQYRESSIPPGAQNPMVNIAEYQNSIRQIVHGLKNEKNVMEVKRFQFPNGRIWIIIKHHLYIQNQTQLFIA
jgi:hypothetical protein